MGFTGSIGIARRDITPPIGIYARQWGASSHDVAEGVHRPLLLTAAAFSGRPEEAPLVLVAMDGFMFRSPDDEYKIRSELLEAAGVGPERLILNVSHTHASCSISLIDSKHPGGDLIAPYQERIMQEGAAAVREAIASAVPAILTWETGCCKLACNRDLPDPAGGRRICGYNPGGEADDTVLVGRMTRRDGGAVLGVIVNYACHPTTLAWQNRLISPDFVGAAREVVEQVVGAPMLFLQGASGELAPRYQYTGDVSVADANGRQLGYSALAVLEAMMPPEVQLTFAGVRESGAPLAIWAPTPVFHSEKLAARVGSVPFPLKPLPTEAEVQHELERCQDRALQERLHRKRAQIRFLGPGPTCDVSYWIWTVGNAVFVAQPNEAYSDFQIELRRTFPDHPVIVMNLSNGASGSYLYPARLAVEDVYQVWVSPFGRDALSLLIDACREAIKIISGTV